MRKFVWIDLETTGLDPKTCEILEIACIMTDEQMSVLGEFEVLVKPGSSQIESGAHAMHKKSGLIEAIASPRACDIRDAGDQLYRFITSHESRKNRAYLAGSSVHFDASFITKYIPQVSEHLCSRYLDVNSLNLALSAKLGNKNLYFTGNRSHRAKSDILDTIQEYKFYMTNFIK